MITEDYVSYETAKLLKEKGFDGECFAYHLEKDNILGEYGKTPHTATSIITYSILHDDVLLCPTHQMAMKWLREKGIECVVIPIWNTIGKQYRSYVLSDLDDKYKDNYDSYSDNISYEKAAEAVLKYSLENLV